MSMSKIYGVKSNAARAAAAYKLTRADLVAVSGGWCFPIPELNPEMAADLAANAAEAMTSPFATSAHEPDGNAVVQSDGLAAKTPDLTTDPNEPDVPDARTAHTVVNGAPREVPYVDPIGGADWVETIEADKTCAEVSNASKPARQRREKAASKPKSAKRTKAPRPVVDGTTKRGTKSYADKMAARRRAGMNKRGITELVIQEIRTRWTPTSALLKMTGWQPTTLRGVLSLYAKKEGIEIRGETRDGERYYLVAR